MVGGGGRIMIDCQTEKYIVNPGLQAKNVLGGLWQGSINRVQFDVVDVGVTLSSNRIIYPWVTNGAEIVNCTFNVGSYGFSATSSGNDNTFFAGTPVRKNITISGNTLNATASSITSAGGANPGSEGFGLQLFDGVVMDGNRINGCGDDVLAVHFCSNFEIKNNIANSPRGRIFLANSKDGVVHDNKHERIAGSGGFIAGQCLIYVGFESLTVSNTSTAPKNIDIYNNDFVLNDGAIDAATMAYIYAPRNVTFTNNTFTCNSSAYTHSALYLTTAPFTGGATWDDPDNLDDGLNNGRVYQFTADSNIANGTNRRNFQMTGPTDEFIGPVVISNNTASGFTFYGANTTLTNNITA